MNKKNEHWFTLAIHHFYFIKNECTVFDIRPTSATQRIMKNYGIRFQKIKNQYLIYVEVAANKKIWEELRTAGDLYFELINTDPYFNNYTEVILPRKENTVYYFTNEAVMNRFNPTGSSALKTLSYQPLRFNIGVPKDKKSTISIKQNGQEICQLISPEKQATVFIDLNAFGNGIYELWIDNVLSNTFYGASEALNINGLGIFHINLRNALESLKENVLPTLNINFEARATFREYIVVVPEDKKIEVKNITIQGTDNEKYKEPEKKVVFENQGESYIFTSVSAVKLEQKPKEIPLLKVQYVNQFSDVLVEQDMKMPYPSASTMILKNKNNENMYNSQMIIYV